jgi:hypothetical protein
MSDALSALEEEEEEEEGEEREEDGTIDSKAGVPCGRFMKSQKFGWVWLMAVYYLTGRRVFNFIEWG